MRCSLGDKKLRKFSKLLGIKFTRGLTRGGTDHRFDLFIDDYTYFSYWIEDKKLVGPFYKFFGKDRLTLLKEWVEKYS